MNNYIKKLSAQLIEIETYLPASATLNTNVSQVSAGWHLSHSLLTLTKVIENIVQSDPANYKRIFSFAKILVFTINYIPRGKGRAPKTVLPTAISEASLIAQLQEVKLQVEQLKHLAPDKYFDHPYFGHLKLQQATRFMEIHTRHHLKIVREILAD